jgi:catechol 2,3-dioxygenase-like lactoylglutathione lyase family enzyme
MINSRVILKLEIHEAEDINKIVKNIMNQFIRSILITSISVLMHYAVKAQVKKVGAIGITVSEMDRSVKFYTEVLGFTKISDEELWGEEYEKLNNLFGLRMRVVRMKLGEETIELIDYLTSGGRSIPEDAKSNDLTFQHIAIVVNDMDAAYIHLRKYMTMHVSTGPQTIPVSNTAAAGIKAFYFHDPDMHNLELIYFPKGKGNPKWQVRNKSLFLGIDHTAIGVSNTDSSLRFYEGLLGIMRKGDSWNMGMEQAHLNFVQGASLHITGLRAPEGPGIEFLEYIHPGPGKLYPSDSRTDDIWHWQTTLLVDNAMRLYGQLKETEYRFVSEKLIQLKNKNGRVSNAFILRDRDGHAILITDNFEANQHLTQKN